MGDLFHKDVDANWIDLILGVVKDQPRHIYIFLTKRPKRMAHWRFPNNCWLGVTAENQKRADERIPVLLEIPAAVRFVSVEPMLERVKLSLRYHSHGIQGHRKLDWVICGGETGPGARPMKLEWARNLRNQCQNAEVPFFFKKVGRRLTNKGVPI
jgi:protein gp37